MEPTKEVMELSSKTDEALMILGWHGWIPKKGDWFIGFDEPQLVNYVGRGFEIHFEYDGGKFTTMLDEVIPVLDWEKQIEPALEKLGYHIFIIDDAFGHSITVHKGAHYICGSGPTSESKSRQVAMMKVVSALAEAKETKK